jgi:hypothetical protein
MVSPFSFSAAGQGLVEIAFATVRGVTAAYQMVSSGSAQRDTTSMALMEDNTVYEETAPAGLKPGQVVNISVNGRTRAYRLERVRTGNRSRQNRQDKPSWVDKFQNDLIKAVIMRK